MTGSGVGLAVGILGTLYGGLGVAQAAQNAMNTVWRVPRNSRPNPVQGRLRGLRLLSVVGLSILGTTILSGLGASAEAFGANIGAGLKVLLIALSMAVNVAVFALGFKVATARHLSWRQTLPGAVAAAVAWQVLQFFGTAYVGQVVKHAREFNSVFALSSASSAGSTSRPSSSCSRPSTTRSAHCELYPRALLTPFTDNVELTDADEAAYTSQAEAERSKGFQGISVRFDPPPRDHN